MEPATYRMAIDAQGDHAGEYQFRLMNIANAEVIAPGDVLSGILESGGRETDLFQLTATEGQELFFDPRSGSGGTANWTLIDPDG